jgi:hypothetical protein
MSVSVVPVADEEELKWPSLPPPETLPVTVDELDEEATVSMTLPPLLVALPPIDTIWPVSDSVEFVVPELLDGLQCASWLFVGSSAMRVFAFSPSIERASPSYASLNHRATYRLYWIAGSHQGFFGF